MEYNNKAKLKEQNSSRLTDSKKELAVTKGKGVGGGQVVREGGRRGLRGIMISTHKVGGTWRRQYSTEKTSCDCVASYYTDGQ